MPQKPLAAVVSPLGAFGGRANREHRIRGRSQRSERLCFPALRAPPIREVTIRSQQTYTSLTDAFSNKRLLSIFKQCCEKSTRERCRRPNSDVLAREGDRVGAFGPPHVNPCCRPWPRFGGAFLCGTNSRAANCFAAEPTLPRESNCVWPHSGPAALVGPVLSTQRLKPLP